MFRLVVGLGNPGREYEETKHNIAWMLFKTYAPLQSANWKTKFKGLYADVEIKGQKVTFLLPQTYMNLSGESVQPLAAFYKIPLNEILVVHDELDIPFGQVHFKMGGGLAGHNGLKSIAQTMGSDQFARMRIGIGRPVHGTVSDWVLGGFSKEQMDWMPELFKKLHGPLEDCVISGVNKASVVNKKDLI